MEKIKSILLSLQLCLFCLFNAQAQVGARISGVVFDEGNIPIIGASILEKNTANGVITDLDGKFSLKVKSADSFIIVSYIGYVTKEFKVGLQKQIKVVLKEDTKSLDEVVVVGYVTRKKGELTGSVSSVGPDELVKTSNMNLTKSLEGKVPGMIVSDRGGYPGDEDVTLLIRGKSTLGNNAPLVVVDGVSSDNLSSIAPSDIESLTVLKDGAAAIYGARAANGVIVVTTKRGKEGKASVNFSTTYKVSSFTTKPEYINSWQYATWQNEISEASNVALPYTQDDIDKYKSGVDPINYPNTNWYDLTMKNSAPEDRTSLSVTGGGENVKYFVSADMVNQSGMYVSDVLKYHDYQVRSNIDINLNKYIKIGLNLSARTNNHTEPGVTAVNIYKGIYNNEPTSVGMFPNGLYGWGAENGTNPAVMASDQSGTKKTTNDEIRAILNYDINLGFITKGLKFKGLSSVFIHNNEYKNFLKTWTVYNYNSQLDKYEAVSGYDFNTGNFLSLQQYHMRSIEQMHSLQLHYERIFAENHSIKAFVAMEYTKGDSHFFQAYKRDLISDMHPDLFAGGEEGQSSTGSSSEWGRLNYFGSLGYSYKMKYLLDFTLRYDGSNNFAKGHRFGTFPGVSVGWAISQEPFMKSTKSWLDMLKIRASWAIMGNDRIAGYQYLSKYEYGNDKASATPLYYIFGEQGKKYNAFYNTNVANPLITWEKADMRNIGLNFGLFNNRLTGDINYYFQKRNDILVKRSASIPDYTALQLPQENLGKVNNYGFEVQLDWNSQIKDFKYNFGVTFTQAKNKVKYLDEAANVPDWQKQEGHPMDSYLVYPTNGLLQESDFDEKGKTTTPQLPKSKVGSPKYIDTNNNGTIDQQDRIRKYTSAVPEIQYGFHFGASWKGIDFNILFQGQANSEIELCLDNNSAIPTYLYNERWTPENTNAKFPRALAPADDHKKVWQNNQSEGFADFWLADASFLRLKDIELGYTLPKAILPFATLRLFARGSNLLTFKSSDMHDFDPEMAGYHRFNSGKYAPLKSYSFGLNLQF